MLLKQKICQVLKKLSKKKLSKLKLKINKYVTEEVKDEICSNEQYSEAKSITAATRSVTPASTSSKKQLEYHTMTYYEGYADLSDSH